MFDLTFFVLLEAFMINLHTYFSHSSKHHLKFQKLAINHGNQGQQNIEQCEDAMNVYVKSFLKNHVKIQTIACNHVS
jgi:hypothetical protein